MGSSRILVVDDNQDHREIYVAILTHFGYSVLHADDGDLAVRLAQEERPDLILMDVHMPRLCGLMALQRLRDDARTAEIPVIAMTADVVRHSPEALLDRGFNGYLAKPCGLRELLPVIHRVVRPPDPSSPQSERPPV